MSRAVALAALVLLVAGPLGAFSGVLPPVVGFGVYALAGAAGLAAAISGLVSWLHGRRRRDLATALLALPPVAALAFSVIGLAGHPAINDITTDLADPPALAVVPQYPESFKPSVAEWYPDVASLEVALAPAQAFARALDVARSRERWSVDQIDGQALTFQGVATTVLFRFRDDFVVRVRAVAGRPGRAVIDMRSRSRDGKSDLGVNARRIRSFLAELR